MSPMPVNGAAIDPVIDIAIVTWNTRETTLKALEALYLAAPSGTRVLVRDNGSSDGTAEAIAAAYPDVALDAGERNLGFAGGVNTILRRSTAPWVLLLNSDAWPEPGAVERLVACAERHPRAAAVAPRLLGAEGEPGMSTWPFPSITTTVFAGRRGHYDPPPADVAEHTVDWAVGAALLIRRSALESIGELDDSLFMYGEDLDWCWRAHDARWEIWLAPDAVFCHIGNASGVHRYGESQPAKWIPNSVVVYRRRHTAVGTWIWQATNSLSAIKAARSLHRRGDEVNAAGLRLQARAWLRPRQFHDPGDK